VRIERGSKGSFFLLRREILGEGGVKEEEGEDHCKASAGRKEKKARTRSLSNVEREGKKVFCFPFTYGDRLSWEKNLRGERQRGGGAGARGRNDKGERGA